MLRVCLWRSPCGKVCGFSVVVLFQCSAEELKVKRAMREIMLCLFTQEEVCSFASKYQEEQLHMNQWQQLLSYPHFFVVYLTDLLFIFWLYCFSLYYTVDHFYFKCYIHPFALYMRKYKNVLIFQFFTGVLWFLADVSIHFSSNSNRFPRVTNHRCISPH